MNFAIAVNAGTSTRKTPLKARLFAAALIVGICLVLLIATLLTNGK